MQIETVGTYGHEHDVKCTESVRRISTDVEALAFDRGHCYTEHDTIFRVVLLHSTLILHVGSRKFATRVIRARMTEGRIYNTFLFS